MDTKVVVALIAGAIVAVGGAVVIAGKPVDPDPSDVKPVAVAVAAGDMQPSSVYKMARSDGGSVFLLALKDGGAEFVDHSLCAKKPKAVPLAQCSKVCAADPITGKTPSAPCDPGDENVMQNGQYVGLGCVETPCVIYAGDPDP